MDFRSFDNGCKQLCTNRNLCKNYVCKQGSWKVCTFAQAHFSTYDQVASKMYMLALRPMAIHITPIKDSKVVVLLLLIHCLLFLSLFYVFFGFVLVLLRSI